MSTFTVANDESLSALIVKAQHRVAYIAPGITPAVVSAMGEVMRRSHPPSMTVIIDVDPEVCRLGYGTREGLEALHKLIDEHHVAMRVQKGLRVGVLSVDDELLVFSPIAQLVEATPASSSTPNALWIGSEPLAQVLDAAAADGAPGGLPPSEGEVGAQPARPEDVARSLQDLEANPPKAFNLARIERVFSSKLLYVEFKVEGYRLSAHVAKLPSDFLVDSSDSLKKQVRSTLKLFDSGKIAVTIPKVTPPKPGGTKAVVDPNETESVSETSITQSIKAIRERYLHVLPNHGVLMWRANQREFEAQLSALEEQLRLFKEQIDKDMQAIIEEAARTIAKEVLTIGEGRLPKRLLKMLPDSNPGEALLLDVIATELVKAFGKVQLHIAPKVTKRFKDVSYQTLGDAEFRKAIEAHFGKRSFDRIFSEFDAAREAAAAGAPGADRRKD